MTVIEGFTILYLVCTTVQVASSLGRIMKISYLSNLGSVLEEYKNMFLT